MILEAAQLCLSDVKRRILIVGAGPVGIALARALAQRGRPSLLLEGGGMHPVAGQSADLTPDVTAAALRGAHVGRTRHVGGGLNLWGGQLALPHRREVDSTGDAPAGWPIPLGDIAGRARSAAGLLGQEVAFDLVGGSFETARMSLASAGLDLVATGWLHAPKLSPSLWREIESSELITVAYGAFVAGLDVDGGGQIRGVRARTADGTERTFEADCVVLTAGAIETARLLLQPVVEGRAPWANLDWLGRGFNEHLEAPVATVHAKNKALLLDVFDPAIIAGTKYSCKIFGQVQAGAGAPLSAVAMLVLPGNIRNSLAELRMLARGLTPRSSVGQAGSIARASIGAAREVLPLAWRYLRHKRLATALRGAGTLRISLEQPVRRESRIVLSQRPDSRGVPHASIHWLKGEAEGEVFLSMAQRVRDWAEASGAATIAIDPGLVADPTGFAAAADDGLHHAGGARMATRAEDGVVDTNLAVFGARGLYCCGSATFPRLGYANPTLTAVALAERLADHLAGTGA